MIELEEKARYFAAAAHAGQVRKYTEEPYVEHCIRVAQIVSGVPGCTSEMICAALLHDTVEDTSVSSSDILRWFGPKVAGMVFYLTDCPKGTGNRKVRKRVDANRLSGAPPEVQTIKLADLIDNTSTIIAHDPSFAKLYLEEKRALLDIMKNGDYMLYETAIKQCAS